MAYIIYTNVEDAAQAVERFNNCTLNGKVLRVKFSRQRQPREADGEQNFGIKREVKDEIKEEEEEIDKKRVSKKRNNNRGPGTQRKGRIIVRNLSFKVRENCKR